MIYREAGSVGRRAQSGPTSLLRYNRSPRLLTRSERLQRDRSAASSDEGKQVQHPGASRLPYLVATHYMQVMARRVHILAGLEKGQGLVYHVNVNYLLLFRTS